MDRTQHSRRGSGRSRGLSFQVVFTPDTSEVANEMHSELQRMQSANPDMVLNYLTQLLIRQSSTERLEGYIRVVYDGSFEQRTDFQTKVQP